MKLNNDFMKLYMHVDGKKFLITFASADVDAVNSHLLNNEGEGVIATDENGISYVAEVESA